MTPLGHLSVSYVVGRTTKATALVAFIAGGILPDIDFLFILFPWFNQIHRVITHNLLFISLSALFAGILFGRDKIKTVSGYIFLGAALHLLIDSTMDANPSNGIGIALFWPFSDSFFSPFNFLHAHNIEAGWQQPFQMLTGLVPTMIYEVPFYIASLCFIGRERRAKAL